MFDTSIYKAVFRVVAIVMCLHFLQLSSAFGQTCSELFTNNLENEPYALRELRKLGWEPLEGEGPLGQWSIDGPENAFYLKEMGPIIEKAEGRKYLTFPRILKDRKENGEGTHVLDLFGSGFVIRPPGFDALGIDVDSVSGIRYGAFDLSLLPPNYPKNKLPTEILGDALSPATWKKLDQSMQTRKIPKMDLILMRPYGGWDRAPFAQTARGNLLALTYLLQNVIKRISNTGRFYFSLELPQIEGVISDQPDFKDLVEQIDKLTPFKLVLQSRTSINGNTHGLDGALIPKVDIQRKYKSI